MAHDIFDFIGELVLSAGRLFRGRSSCTSGNVWLAVQESGVDALPIVSLISLLVGLILAFVGVIQLKMFGAEIYVSSLVAVSMTRIMGAIMTGIILAGRTGASYAAVIGTMQVNEEIDALTTLGVAFRLPHHAPRPRPYRHDPAARALFRLHGHHGRLHRRRRDTRP